MKRIKLYLIGLLGLLSATSCELDNYDGPDSSLSGGIYDIETNELIQQDIINGAKIEYIEHGYENPELQNMIFKVDGTYQNDLMFAGTYTIAAVRGNFVPTEPFDIKVKGDTKQDFKVQPYIRIKNAKIEKIGNKIVATFNMQQTVTNKVVKTGLYVHIQPTVGEPMCSVKKELLLNSVINESKEYSIELDLSVEKALLAGQQYYFRIGALIDASEAKFNYAPAVRIAL